MKPVLSICLLLLLKAPAFAQNTYADSIRNYLHNYVITHDVISGKDTTHFRFFEPDKAYRVNATFSKVNDGRWFKMDASGRIKQLYRVYGTLRFTIHDTALSLNIYQSQSLMQEEKYRDYLFLPFTDGTTGNETYHTGRYLDFRLNDIKNEVLEIDFNKAYNPSCAYVNDRYSCPIPPKENNLPINIKAGEMNFDKAH